MKSALILFSIMSAMLSSSVGAKSAAASLGDSSGWQSLSPLPDPVGFGGMFAGVLDGKLIVGGGSQFRDKPVWLQGTKVFSDRIFVLADPAGTWREHRSHLPEKYGHFASAATADAIYLAGGIGANGSVATCYALRAQGEEIVAVRLPDLPKPLGYGAAAVVGERLFVVGGQQNPADKAASVEAWSLPVGRTAAENTGWKREADLPGPGVFVPSAASDGKGLYLFGGMAFDAAGKFSPSKNACRYDPVRGAWERLPDLPEPRVAAASPCALLPDGRIFVVGGYAEVFPGAPREHPGFSTQTLLYDPAQRRWSTGPVLPRAAVANRDLPGDAGPAPMVAAPCASWRDLVVVISGEVRASVRSPSVLAWPLSHSGSAQK